VHRLEVAVLVVRTLRNHSSHCTDPVGYPQDMTTTPSEPSPEPTVVPSGDPGPESTPEPEPGEDPGVPTTPDVDPDPAETAP